MSAIDQLFAELRAEGRKAFMPFITAGDPDLEFTADVLRELSRCGCNLCELGIPYSDPIADGATIQASYTRALEKHVRLGQILDTVRATTPELTMPIVTMVSYSIVYRHGLREYVQDAKAAGVAGAIVPDLLVDEADEFAAICRAEDFSLILLVTPTTPRERAIRIANLSTGFLYYVSVTGITGERATLPADLADNVAWMRRQTDLPICIGFGIRGVEQVELLAPVADGLIVGSAIVRRLAQTATRSRQDVLTEIGDFAQHDVGTHSGGATASKLSMTRVLILCEYSSLNGGERSMLAVLNGLQSSGFDVAIVGPPRGDLPNVIAAAGYSYAPVELHDGHGVRRELAVCRQRLAEIITRQDAELVHANSLSMSRLAGPVVADLSLPSIGHIRDILGVSRAVIADVNRHRRLLAVSAATREFYTRAGLDPSKLFVCYNGVDLRQFRPRPPTGNLHREMGLTEDALLVGTIGQIGMRKGLHILVQAARQVCMSMPRVHFLVIGQRYSRKAEAVRYESELLRAASRGALAGRFHFLGMREKIATVLNDLSILAHAAQQEPLGRVLLEAAACGRPVVATDVGGTREIFPDDTAAILVPPDEPQRFAQALLTLLKDATLRQALGDAARRRAEQAFDARHAAATLTRHYRAAMGDVGAANRSQSKL